VFPTVCALSFWGIHHLICKLRELTRQARSAEYPLEVDCTDLDGIVNDCGGEASILILSPIELPVLA
jgi:hypothetical protein